MRGIKNEEGKQWIDMEKFPFSIFSPLLFFPTSMVANVLQRCTVPEKFGITRNIGTIILVCPWQLFFSSSICFVAKM